MAFLNADSYSDLSGHSAEGGGAREKGLFTKVFISSSPRGEQLPGHMHAISEWGEGDIPENFLFVNKREVYFLPMFIKKVRELVETNPVTDRRSLRWFSYSPDEDVEYPTGAKVSYIIAGALLNEKFEKVPDAEDPERAAFIHFKANGVKVGKIIDYLKILNEKYNDIDRLCGDDQASFEKAVVMPRRFITKASVTTAPTSFGDRYVFQIEPHKQLPNEVVKDVMDKSLQWLEPFDKQFDMSGYVKTSSQDEEGSSSSDRMPTFDDSPSTNNDTTDTTDVDLTGVL